MTDLFVWSFFCSGNAECHEQVRDLMPLAVRHNVAVIPVGGGTNVTGALDCSSIDVARMIVSLDTSQMNQVNTHAHRAPVIVDTAIVFDDEKRTPIDKNGCPQRAESPRADPR